ncbi:receptor-like protein kinase ANXUR1 [Salvia hispanica]|uniref:receptor-like protein kinase ANXUR1 n=1 Tax=Salvia hispanica TaxID=49212 RepID=UPI00200938EE|nr:receptor-like protein kinase ANXUR1 [Salvia hispanica]
MATIFVSLLLQVGVVTSYLVSLTPTCVEKLCRRFSLAEIQSATGDFSDDYVIGKGGFAEVYNNRTVLVAIMRRLASNRDQGQGRTEFVAEIETLSKFRHYNLVVLIGYCDEEGEMILVYDYMSNGTLADHLYNLGTSLSWNERLKICIGAGRGLDHLHSGCSIIHRDVKPTNILLDHDFTAKVSDFGLAKHLGHNMSQTHVTTHVKGSFGYFDPSYFTTGRLTKGSDTYAFGVILLEVLSGRPAVEHRLDEDQLCMSTWAQEKIRNGKAGQIVNPYLKGDISEICLKTFVGVVKRCLHHDPKKRLTMSRVVAQLELALEQQERSTHKDVNEVKVDVHVPASPLAETNDITDDSSVIPFGKRSTSMDENEVEVDTLSKAIRVDHTINMLPIYVPSIP